MQRALKNRLNAKAEKPIEKISLQTLPDLPSSQGKSSSASR
jgi:hypothetical protein